MSELKKHILFILTISWLMAAVALAAGDSNKGEAKSEAKPGANSAEAGTTNPQGPEGGVEWVDVNKIKEKYWARGDDSELGVVQNRLYSKEKKLEVSPFLGLLSSDPFLSIQTIGGTVGFHFSEYLSAHVLGWYDLVGPSSALNTFISTSGATANTNQPRGFIGAEANGSILYGKLSVLGRSIIYYDLHVLGGMGLSFTESGNYFGPTFGLGQQVFLSKLLSVRVDYRALYFYENILEKVIPTKLGQVTGSRANWTHSVTLGISFFFGSDRK